MTFFFLRKSSKFGCIMLFRDKFKLSIVAVWTKAFKSLVDFERLKAMWAQLGHFDSQRAGHDTELMLELFSSSTPSISTDVCLFTDSCVSTVDCCRLICSSNESRNCFKLRKNLSSKMSRCFCWPISEPVWNLFM